MIDLTKPDPWDGQRHEDVVYDRNGHPFIAVLPAEQAVVGSRGFNGIVKLQRMRMRQTNAS